MQGCRALLKICGLLFGSLGEIICGIGYRCH
jgi:hypothetical protein